MTYYDIFNGDADGLCALHQLRLSEPRDAVLVTGVKRDVRLVERVDARDGDELVVLDISMHENAAALTELLARGVRCRYFDHHFPGAIPAHEKLETFIDTRADLCTSLIVDRYLDGRWRAWAVVAAFGDNVEKAAYAAAAPLRLDAGRIARLAELGRCLNYNGYGERVEDLHYAPVDLYRMLSGYSDPFAFIENEAVFDRLRDGRAGDLALAAGVKPTFTSASGAVYVLPDAAWSRRVVGTFANDLARTHEARAHAVLVAQADGYSVSVRAPLAHPTGADALCRRFPGGGGRAAAAGINSLSAADLDRFVAEFMNAFGS